MNNDQLALFGGSDDADARHAIRTRLDETLFVEAGAGTGKTAALVDRIVALVRDDGVPLAAIAAITFTDKAAAELRDRVRRELEREARTDARCRAAIDDLDAAAICTLHAFAQRLLTDFPVEARLPPRIEVRDEIASAVAFDDRWSRNASQLLEDAEEEDTMLLALAAGVTVDQLRGLAEAFAANWDLLDRVPDPPPLPTLALPGLGLDDWIAELEAVCAERGGCIDGADRMAERLTECEAYARALRRAPEDAERIRLLRREKPSLRVGRVGRKPNWRGCDLDVLRDRILRLAERRTELLERVSDATIRRLAVTIARFTAEDAMERRAAGELEFHDLLVLARALLRDPEHGARARRRLAARYQRLLIDEFQDTDPIQVELAVLLAHCPEESSDRDAGAAPWPEISVDPGRVFFVGDPKQSIYRFRRADIATFLSARDRYARPPLLLTRNFRTVPSVLRWVNQVFGELIRPFPGSQPEYRALEPARTDPPTGPPVVLLGADAHTDDLDADTLREREAADVAAAIGTIVAQGWAVHDDEHGWRDARLGDICILLPARTSLAYLEHALDTAGIAYRAETSSLVYGSREVRDLLAALRAVDDPTDSLALVTALRSPLFGCGDDDLFDYHVEHGGRWDVTAEPPATVSPGHPVAEGIAYLKELHQQRSWSAPSELLERIVRDRRMLEVGVTTGRFRDVGRRLRFIVDQARAFTDTTAGALREYLSWAARQGAEGSRVVETVLPETDDDAVRILTIHGAKGLEFPIVIASGMTTRAQTRRGGVRVLFPPDGGVEIRLASGVQTDRFELHQPVDEQMGFHEKLRLLYVAATRARDHLVVSVHRKDRPLPPEASTWTHAELLYNSMGDLPSRDGDVAALDTASRHRLPAAASPAPPSPPPAQWLEERARAFAQGQKRRFVAATTLARRSDGAVAATPAAASDPGLAKDARDLELPPWNKGRYGTAIGRAVHAVLQTVDLATGTGVRDAAAAQAAAEGVLGHDDTIAALATAALESATVRAASTRPFWRETYVAVPAEGMTLEGYVDLVYRDDDGLVVVDYKTDAVGDDDELARRLDHYRVQGAAYAFAVATATGERVTRCVFVFCDPAGAREVTIGGAELDEAVRRVQVLLAAERDTPSPLEPAVFAEV
jgi:ATP-dependent exoDNAse (exonuclease V) beta subunit